MARSAPHGKLPIAAALILVSQACAGSDPMTDMQSPARPGAPRHITLTSHPRAGRAKPPKIVWGAASPAARGR